MSKQFAISAVLKRAACNCFDDVIISEARAAHKENQEELASVFITGSAISCPAGQWTKIATAIVPNVDHEVLYCWGRVQNQQISLNAEGYARICIEGEEDWFPSPDGIYIYGAGIPNVKADDKAPFVVPKSCSGKTVELWFKPFYTNDHIGQLTVWGHSPHSHPAR